MSLTHTRIEQGSASWDRSFRCVIEERPAKVARKNSAESQVGVISKHTCTSYPSVQIFVRSSIV